MKQLVKVINRSKNPLPSYETAGSAGMDLRANLEEPITLQPMERKLIPTGLFMEIPMGYEGQIRPRSGMAIKHGLSLINCVGTIDSDYRGEVKIPMINLSNEAFTIEHGERVAQFVLAAHGMVEWQAEETLNDTKRGAGGFGSTGK
ncbi:dUTP diphosphatase [Acidaminobacter sp. JC074]|uniref:dUTP diphosphatase n=1 Tax=Acidaminobacter sp. JC074 TaxID=2530199 RepID=UPI001F0EA4B4|nr:dUTP diphosphatase [Acidaminobacter sp. JC074]MCH4890918.1 dUTP diphosphatase [Acidaminobacter sp. JC074]